MTDQPDAGSVLVRRMLAGEERAFDEFFEECFARLYRFARSRLDDDAAAEEVAQATLCRAISRLETYRGEAALFTWLCTICRHEIADHLGRAERHAVARQLPEDSPEARAALESLARSLQDGPEERLDRQEVGRLVQVTLDSMPARYARVLEWKYMEEIPVSEIAGRLEVGLKAAESLLTRARHAFREGFAGITGTRWQLRPAGPDAGDGHDGLEGHDRHGGEGNR